MTKKFLEIIVILKNMSLSVLVEVTIPHVSVWNIKNMFASVFIFTFRYEGNRLNCGQLILVSD